jgi:branched-chain amino acid transport system ATP-binding protein
MNDQLLVVSGLTKRFGGLKAVDDVNFSVERGRIYALIGPNGAGKTTVFNLVTGFLSPNSGAVRFADQDVTGWRPDRLARIGLVRTFQIVRPFGEMTVLENILVGFHTRTRGGLGSSLLKPPSIRQQEKTIRAEAQQILTLIGLQERAEERAGNLTFGQQRFLEIGRSLAVRPRLLMADEPAAGLNHAETAFLGDLLGKLRDEGLSILLVEHDVNLVMRIAEHIVVLDFGRKIAEGPPQVIQEDPAVHLAYLGGTEEEYE